jgi:hypothetical protein
MKHPLLGLFVLLACGLGLLAVFRTHSIPSELASGEPSRRPQSSNTSGAEASSGRSPLIPAVRRSPPADAGQAFLGPTRAGAVPVESADTHPDANAGVWHVRPVALPDTKECASDLNCPENHACLTDPIHNKNHCLPANCRKDEECPQGQGCRVVNAADTRGPVRRCVIAGNRLEGQSCATWPNGPNSACDEGLVCANGRCGRPCDTHGPNSCPPAFACASTNMGEDICMPDCRRDGCPQGKSCIPFGKSMALCLAMVTADCRDPGSECPTGQHCGFSYSPDSVVFHCTRECSTFDSSACQQNEVCGAIAGEGRCLQRCDPKQPASCPANFRCWYADETRTSYACLPHAPFKAPNH